MIPQAIKLPIQTGIFPANDGAVSQLTCKNPKLPGGHRLAIHWQSSASDLSQELWTACFPPPLEGRWWYSALERSGLESQFKFEYGLIESNGRPIGIVPIFLMDVPIDLVAPPIVAWFLRGAGRVLPSLRYQRTLFVGSPCADEGTIGLLPGVALGDVVDAIEDAIETRCANARASMIVWKDFPDETERGLSNLWEKRGLFKVISYPGTRVPLPGDDFEKYLKSLSASHRHNLRKKLRRSRQMGSLSASVVQRIDASMIDEIFSLFWQTYKKGKTKFEVLNRRFFEVIAEEQLSHFVLLRDDRTQRLVAFMLCFRVGSRVINKFIGIDYSYDGGWHLYFRLWEAAVEWATRLGVREIQSGQTGYRAKLDVGHSLVPLTNYCKHRNALLHRLFAIVARRIEWSGLDHDLKVWLTAHPETVSPKLPTETGRDE